MFKKKEKKDTASVFFYPSLKNTIVDTFFILFIAAIGTATYFGIDMIMSKIISFFLFFTNYFILLIAKEVY